MHENQKKKCYSDGVHVYTIANKYMPNIDHRLQLPHISVSSYPINLCLGSLKSAQKGCSDGVYNICIMQLWITTLYEYVRKM